jgi:nucleoside-diphosphate-sugar epimerase
MPTAIVTGATGFVGSHLVDRLLDRGYRVSVTVRPQSPSRWLDGKPVERIPADFSRPGSLPPCDLLFHVAGVIRADSYAEYLAGNRDLAVAVFDAARAGRFVHVSSLAVVGPGENVDESTPCAPISLYGRSKWEGEQEVWRRRGRTPVTVVRPPVVYGPRDFGLIDLYRTLARGLRPEIGGRKVVSLVHAADLAEGMVRAAESPAGANEVFLLANRAPWAMSDLLDLIERALDRRAWRLPVPDRVVRFLGAIAEDGARLAGKRSMFCRDKALEMTQKAWTCSPEKAKRVLGWEGGVPVERGMAETLAWYRDRGFLT